MSEVAARALARLLALAENAHARASSGRRISLLLSPASFPDYQAIPSAVEKAACNAAFKLAAHIGAIEVAWDPRAEATTHAQKLLLKDAEALARHLDLVPRWSAVDAAKDALDALLEAHPVLLGVLERWRRGVAARGTHPPEVQTWIDAARVIAYCTDHVGDDIPVRRLSASLFGNSKRLETLWPQLDALQQGSLDAGLQRAPEEVSAQLGLVKFPPTLLLSIDGQVACHGHRSNALQPYFGVSPAALEQVWLDPGVNVLMSVENLTTFHELAQARRQRPDVALIYTAGMPSPSWLRAHAILLRALPAEAKLVHWGDIDAGGFRIAAHIATSCSLHGRSLTLHGMMPAPRPGNDTATDRAALTSSELAQAQRLCSKWNWAHEAEALASNPFAVEQEAMPLSWPAPVR